MPPLRRRTEHAFTLIEVLIALAVIAIGLIAVLGVAAQSGRIASDLQERSFARWVAENQITQLRLSPAWPEVGNSDGKVTLGDLQWHWETTVAATPDPDLRRATVAVALADSPDKPVAQLIAFIGKPMPKPVGAPTAGSAGNPAQSPTGTSKPGSAGQTTHI